MGVHRVPGSYTGAGHWGRTGVPLDAPLGDLQVSCPPWVPGACRRWERGGAAERGSYLACPHTAGADSVRGEVREVDHEGGHEDLGLLQQIAVDERR